MARLEDNFARQRISPRGWGLRTVILAFALLAWLLPAKGASFSAALDRTTIALGETATLSLSFQGSTPKNLPPIQAPPGLTIQYAGDSRQIVMSNGRTTSTISYNYQVSASRIGEYVIPAIEVTLNGQTLSGGPLNLRVIKSATPNALAFLRLIPSKNTVYEGEVFAIEIQLYLGAKQDSLQMPQIEGDGFFFGKIPQPTESTAQVGNQLYTIGTFRASAVAVKTGKLTLGPAQCSLVLHIPVGTRNRGFFDDFFSGGVQRRPVTLSSDPQTINVLPLPTEGRPPDFNGAVGNFSLDVEATPTNVATGDPITLRVRVSGQGNLESLPFPGGTDWPAFKLYPPSGKVELSDPVGLSGVKTFERVVIPQDPEIRKVPSIALSFFDPERRTFQTLNSQPIGITVTPNQSGPPQPTVLASTQATNDSEPPRRDIVHIKPYLGTVTPPQGALLTRPWFLGLQVVPILVWLSALVWRKRCERLENNPRLRRRLFVSEVIRKGSKDLSHFAEGRDGEAFFAAVFRLLQERLGERLNLPASSITEAVVDEHLNGQVPAELVSRLHNLFQLCNQARYAPHPSSQELMGLVPEVTSVLDELRRLPPTVAAR